MPFWNRSDSALDREIAHHLQQLAGEFRSQGYSPDEAMIMARREFGGSEQVKEECRDERRWAWLTGLRQDLSFGFRMMRRTPAITIAAVLSLALGIGANTAIVSLMDVILWRDLPVPNPRQLVLVNWTGKAGGFPREVADSASGSMYSDDGGGTLADFFSYPSYLALRDGISPRARLAAYQGDDQVSTSFGGRASVAQQRLVTGNFLSTLEVRPQLGRLLSSDDDRPGAHPAVVVSHRFWINELGSARDVIGRTLTLDRRAFVIAGVLERKFTGLNPGDATDVYVPMLLAPESRRHDLADSRNWGISMLARLSPGVTPEQLTPAMNVIFPTTFSRPVKDKAREPRIRLDDGSRGLGGLRREFRKPLIVLGGLVLLLLVIACTNIANLLLARATARQKEVATRISLGCSQSRLMRQFLTESAMLAVAGGLVSLFIAYGTANLLARYVAGHDGAPIAVSFDSRIVAVAASSAAFALLLFGLFPAWKASRVRGSSWLKEGAGSIGVGARRRWHAGRALVLIQMALSVVLVMSAVIFTRNLLSIETSDPGWDRRNLVMFGLRPGTSGYDPARLPGFYYQLEKKLAETPGVSVAAFASFRPMDIGGWWESVRLAEGGPQAQVNMNGVSPAYLPLYVPRLLAGRNIRWADIVDEAKVAVISEDLAKTLGGTRVLGRRLQITDGPPNQPKPEYEIVGIAPAIAVTSMKERPSAVWLPFGKASAEVTVVIRTSQRPRNILPGIRNAVGQIDPHLPLVDVTTMEEQISKGLERERMFATVCSGFGILALVLSVVGLYGVIAYSTSRRRREIGVRLALGAIPRNVVGMVLREGLSAAIAGMLVGVTVACLCARYLEKELFQMKPLEPLSFALTLGTMFLASLLAVFIPAVRASGLAPAETLRQE